MTSEDARKGKAAATGGQPGKDTAAARGALADDTTVLHPVQMGKGVPSQMTHALEEKLRAAGYSEQAIHEISPADAWKALGGIPAAPGPDSPVPDAMPEGQRNAKAAAVIRLLLAGNAPDNTDPASCGGWADTLTALYSAHASGGTKAVKDTFIALAKADPGLHGLISKDASPIKTRWTPAELYATEFPEPQWAVPDIIPVGLTFLAGRPKVGKSWLALQIAGAVGTGGRALDRSVKQGRVLYIALEDPPRRLKNRIAKQRIPGAAAITFETTWTALPDGGLIDIQKMLETDSYTLIVIDTLSRALGKADQQDLAEMTTILGNLQRMAQLYNLAILLIDHHRKPAGMIANPIDDILGSTAKAAVADAALGLTKEQGKHGATLQVTGRDLEELELALDWDGLTCSWQVLGEAGEVRKQSFGAEVVQAIRDITTDGEVPATTGNIANHLSRNKAQVSRALADLLQEGFVYKGPKTGKLQPYIVADQKRR